MVKYLIPWLLIGLILTACSVPKPAEHTAAPPPLRAPDPMLANDPPDNVQARKIGWARPARTEPAPPKPPPVRPLEGYEEGLKTLGYLIQGDDLGRRMAVLHFQADMGLVADGVWGEATDSLLSQRLVGGGFSYADQVSRPPSEGLWMTINKTRRVLTLYEGSAAKAKYPVATGATPDLTPEGQFTIVQKVVNPQWKNVPGGIPQNPLGYRWMGLSIGGGSIYGVHGTNEPWSIGTYASHGCIRMFNSDVEQHVFPQAFLGMPVWIGTDARLAEWGVVLPSSH